MELSFEKQGFLNPRLSSGQGVILNLSGFKLRLVYIYKYNDWFI